MTRANSDYDATCTKTFGVILYCFILGGLVKIGKESLPASRQMPSPPLKVVGHLTLLNRDMTSLSDDTLRKAF